jgi:hypothetical protein
MKFFNTFFSTDFVDATTHGYDTFKVTAVKVGIVGLLCTVGLEGLQGQITPTVPALDFNVFVTE